MIEVKQEAYSLYLLTTGVLHKMDFCTPPQTYYIRTRYSLKICILGKLSMIFLRTLKFYSWFREFLYLLFQRVKPCYHKSQETQALFSMTNLTPVSKLTESELETN